MKKIIYLALVTLMLGAYSCKKDEQAPAGKLTATPTEITFDADGGTQTIGVKARNVAWKATTEANWLTLEKESGTADGEISVMAPPHLQDVVDTATIFIRGEGVQTVTVKVTRKACRKLWAMPTWLEFPANGGTLLLDVKAVNVDWEATTEAGWLALDGPKGSGDGRISVVATSSDTGKADAATIVLRGKGVDDVTVNVTRNAGAAVIWDRSSLSRMNLRGAVKSVSQYESSVESAYMEDLTFDENGMLTSFIHEQFSGPKLKYTLTYDAENRLTKCAASDRSVEIAYGDHGQYVFTEDIFIDIAYLGVTADYPLWLPRFIKNMSTITAKAPGKSGTNTIIYRFDIEGGAIYEKYNEYPEEIIAEISFENGFMSSAVMGGLYQATTSMQVNTQNGNILTYKQDDGSAYLLTKTYNDDRINSVAAVDGDIKMVAQYNKDLDITKLESSSDADLNLRMSYPQYDTWGNWTKMKLSGASNDLVDRTISYYGE